MRVLVVGGAGYIGSIVTRMLKREGIEPVVFDNLSKGHKAAVPQGCMFFEGDMGNAADLDLAFSGSIDAVMHFGAFIEVGESVKDPASYFQNNFVRTMALLKAMQLHKVDKLIFSSTAAVYGDPDKSPITESFPLVPTSPYGETKLAVEKLLKWYSLAYGIKYVSMRYFNAAGAFEDAGEDHHPESHLIPLLLQVADGTKNDVTIYGEDYDTPDGTCIRDYIHVRDLASAHLKALNYLVEGGRCDAFNLGSGTGASVKEIITVARRVTGNTITTKSGNRRAGDPAVLVASNDRIKSLLGWQPMHSSLEEIIGDAWRWKQEHPQGYKSRTDHASIISM